jgi:histidinol-phosphate aminotransferase
MSKIYALSGSRIGYCLANKNIINLIKRQIPPWSVNSYAAEEALKIHNNNQSITAYYNNQLKELLISKNTFCNGIRDIVRIINEELSINYIFFYSDIENINELLLENGVKIRTYRGLHKYYRIAVPNISVVDNVIKAFVCSAA